MSVQETTQIEQLSEPQGEVDQQQPAQGQQTTPKAEGAAQGQNEPSEAQGQEGEQQTEQTERDEKGRFKGVQPRIDELTRARREAEREAAYWRQVAQQAQPSAQQAAPTKPTADQFENYADFVEALTDWKAEQAVAKRLEQDNSRKAEVTRAETFSARQAEARASIPDYDEVVGASEAPIAQHVAVEIMDSERGAELTYHFAKNPSVLERLNGMTPTQAAREIGKLEATLPKIERTAPPSKKLSNTPAPAGTLGSQGRSTTPPLANMSMDEYMAQRKQQGARWAR